MTDKKGSAPGGVFRIVRMILSCLIAVSFSYVGANGFAQEEVGKKSWAQRKAEIKNILPEKREEYKNRLKRLRIVRRPKTFLSSHQADPSLWEAMTGFYDYISTRELDVYEEQEGIPGFFPDRDSYYDFLDTVLPPMRDRRFERNRLLEYRIHEISPLLDSPDKVDVTISVTSDDIFPFGKIMICTHQWIRGADGWYPGKVSAEPATWWERIR